MRQLANAPPDDHAASARADAAPASRIGRRTAVVIGAILLGFQFLLQLHLCAVDAQTSDEGVHLSAGYSYWEWGNFQLNPEHPPLVKLLAGATAHLVHPVFPTVQHPDRVATFFYDSWRENRALGEAFLYQVGNDAERLLFYGRLPVVMLTSLLGISIFGVWYGFSGPLGAVLSTTMYVLDPTIAAHGHLITTDVAVSLGGVAVFAAAWRLAHAPIARNVVLLGAALGLASLAKFTSVIFLALLPTVLVPLWGPRTLIRRLPLLAASILIGWAVIVIGYRGSLAVPPPMTALVDTLAPDNQQSDTFKQDVGRLYSVIRLFGAPRDYFKGLALMLGHVANGQESYLLGRRSMTGWWYYFPVVFAAKTPVPALLLLVLTLATTAHGLGRPSHWYWLALGAGYFACAMTSRSDLGFRHVMPSVVFLAIWIGSLADQLRRRRWLAVTTAVLVAWLAADFARSYDGYLTYFNEMVGDRGYLIATDSNLDWGQDLKRIRAYLDRHPDIQEPYVDYRADGEPSLDYYRIRRRALPPNPGRMSGVLIVGASALANPRYDFLRARTIDERITPGVFVFRLAGGRP